MATFQVKNYLEKNSIISDFGTEQDSFILLIHAIVIGDVSPLPDNVSEHQHSSLYCNLHKNSTHTRKGLCNYSIAIILAVRNLCLSNCKFQQGKFLDLNAHKINWYVYTLDTDGPTTQVETDEADEEITLATHLTLPSKELFTLWENLYYEDNIKENVKGCRCITYK